MSYLNVSAIVKITVCTIQWSLSSVVGLILEALFSKVVHVTFRVCSVELTVPLPAAPREWRLAPTTVVRDLVVGVVCAAQIFGGRSNLFIRADIALYNLCKQHNPNLY